MSIAQQLARTASAALAALTLAAPLRAQPPAPSAVDCAKVRAATDHATMDHAAHQAQLAACAGSGARPTMPGQSAFAAIAEVVRLLDADPSTDWSRVNLEALRQHLADMDEVTLRASVSQRAVPGGLELVVTGAPRTAAAIRRMVVAHARMLDQSSDYAAAATVTATGARLVVTAERRDDARLVGRLRALGFAGLLTEGDHHAAHHLALARGEGEAHHR